MKNPTRTLLASVALSLAVSAIACHDQTNRQTNKQGTSWVNRPVALHPTTMKVPPVETEFRGVWLTSVENINWPSKPGLGMEQQKKELLQYLDKAVEGHFNAVIFQVRPCADAFYKSDLEPWSYYLTGEIGKDPGWDPLAFACEAAHARGLELHAWLNPFRVKQSGSKAVDTPAAINVQHPEWVRKYGKLLWMDPADPEVRAHSLAVVNDIVKRYDVDGVHIDDYFYPYPVEDEKTKKDIEFPDDATFAKYGNGMSRHDFRRAAINDFIEKLYTQTKATKSWVKVGISPFAIWRPGNPAQIKGFDSYDKLYGDSKLWLREGWVDYMVPQLYWAIGQTPQSFPVLLNWWLGENVKGRYVWSGLYSSKTDGPPPKEPGAAPKWEVSEIEYQIRTTRGMTPPPLAPGEVHFSASFFGTGNKGKEKGGGGHYPLFEHLKKTVYSEAAPLPGCPWLAAPADAPAPVAPSSASAEVVLGGNLRVSWSGGQGWVYVVQWGKGDPKKPKADPVWKQKVVEPVEGKTAEWVDLPIADPVGLAIYAVDRYGRMSKPLVMAPAKGVGEAMARPGEERKAGQVE